MIVIRIIQGSTIAWAVVLDDSQVTNQLLIFIDLLVRLSTECEDYTFRSSNSIEWYIDQLLTQRRLEMSGDNGNWEITLEQVDSINSMEI